MANDPVLIAYAVWRRRSGKGVNYVRIGRAYPHDSGDGLTVVFDSWPVREGWHIILLELDAADDRRLLARAARRKRARDGERQKRMVAPESPRGRSNANRLKLPMRVLPGNVYRRLNKGLALKVGQLGRVRSLGFFRMCLTSSKVKACT